MAKQMMMRILMIAAMLSAVMAAPRLAGANSITVLAVVDGFPISSIDFEQRRNFLVKTTGIEINAENSEQINRDVLQMLIDDVIKTREGLSFGSGFEVSARQRAKELVRASFSRNGEDPEQVMQQLGIDPEVAEAKFLADVLWASTVQARFSKQFSNTRQEAEQELERIKKNIQKPHMNLDEIVLVPGPNRDYSTTKKLAAQIYDALTKGADFGRIAQQYSSAGSGREGGSLGWVLAERLPEKISTILLKAPAASIIKPIDNNGTIIIYRVNSQRINGNTDVMETEIVLSRLVYELDLTDAAAVKAGQDKINAELKSVKTCADIEAMHEKYGSKQQSKLGQFKLGEFAPQLRQVLVGLGTNERTDAIAFSEGLVAFMVCERMVPSLILPELDEIETSIRNRHYSALSARLLSRLRKKAIINYKDAANG